MVGGIERRFFEGDSKGKQPIYSLSDLDQGNFKTCGEIMAASLAQGGPPPNFLTPWCYRYLCSGEVKVEDIDAADLAGDPQYTDLIAKVESATENTISNLCEEIIHCGYTGLVNMEKKTEIVRTITLHATLRLLPILKQMRDGLKLYGMCELMSKYPEICRPLFVPGAQMTADADFVISAFQAEYSEKGSNKEYLEMTLMNHFQDLLQELEQGETELEMEEADQPSGSPKAFLQWLTGQGHIPISAQEKMVFQITVKFNHHCESDYGEHQICYPVVAACTNTVTLPVKHMLTYGSFKAVMMEAFQFGQEFSKI